MSSKVMYSSKYYPSAILLSSILAHVNDTPIEVSPDKIILEEGSKLEKLLEALLLSPTLPILLQEMASDYLNIRREYDEHLNSSLGTLLSEAKEKGYK